MKTSLATIALLISSFATQASLPVFSIGTNTFSFAFQDQTLSEENKEIIAGDIARLVTTAWTNAPVVFSGLMEGDVLFSSLGNPPFSKLRPFPSHFNSADTNGVLLLSVETQLSNDYLDRIQLVNTYTQQVSAVQPFISFLSSDGFSSMPAESVSQFFYMDGLNEEGYRAAKDSWINESVGVYFSEPSILSFEEVQGLITGENQSFTVQVPIQRLSPDGSIRNSSVPAVWIDGRWKLYVVAW